MTDQNSFTNHTLLIKNRIPSLPEHFPHRPESDLRIIRCRGKLFRQLRIRIFQIRKPDIHETFQLFQHLRTLVSAAVEQYRDPRAVKLQSGADLGHPVVRSHQVDICSPLFLQLPENIREPLCGDLLSSSAPADLPVLAEPAPECTAAEKYGTGSRCAADARLFAKMQRRPGDAEKGAASAGALSLCSVCAAVSGTQDASFHFTVQISHGNPSGPHAFGSLKELFRDTIRLNTR